MPRVLNSKRLTLAFIVAAGYLLYTLTMAAADSDDSIQTLENTSETMDTIVATDINAPIDESPAASHTDAVDHEEETAAHGEELVSEVLLGLILVLLAAKLGGDIFERFKSPAVLGELVMGVVIGNMYLTGIDLFEPFKQSEILSVLAEIGVIILLFSVGLESTIDEMMKVGAAAFMVATFGVIAPFFLGWGVAILFLPDQSTYVHIFIGATLTATSVGITARVLKDIRKIRTREAKIILGAAVIDDIMGLVILAVVTGIINAANSGGEGISSGAVLLIVGKAVAFVIGAIVIGNLLAPTIFKVGSKMKVSGVLLSIALMVCFLLSFLASKIGLAPIVGAFAAGLILEKVHYKDLTSFGERSIEDLIDPIAIFLVPIFFVGMGMKVELQSFANTGNLFFAGVLTLAAIIGKQACSLAVFDRSINRLSIGLGMIPRGEVGLIFAAIGASMFLDGIPVVNSDTYSAVIIMVMITTLVTPPLLKYTLLRDDQDKAAKKADGV